jgi:hypothetical protein
MAMTNGAQEIVLVYNADGGMFAALMDSVHKVVSPATYSCPLCKVSHGAVSMRFEWRNFLGQLPNRKIFYHRDEFNKLYPDSPYELPAIFLGEATGELSVLIGRLEMERLDDVEDLIALMKERLAIGG